MSTTPPEWKKPSDIMKVMRRKRTSTKSPAVSRSGVSGVSPAARNSPQRTKRKNPFGCSPRRKMSMKLEEATGETTRIEVNTQSEGVLLDILNKNENDSIVASRLTSPVPTPVSDVEDILSTPVNNRLSVHKSEERRKVQEISPHYPKDWCLKLKTRSVSSSPFNWCCPLKTVDEARGMANFVQNTPPLKDLNGKLPSQCAEAKAEFHRCCLYWLHPNIPWLKLFPRITTDSKMGKTSAVLQDKEVLDSLMADWTESYTSIFHLLRAGLCPYFYMCCHQFTVAFFAARTRSDQMEAVVTPTSRGLREALKAEDIEFTLPLQARRTSTEKPVQTNQTQGEESTKHSSPKAELNAGSEGGTTRCEGGEKECQEEEQEPEDEDDLDNADGGAASWLETLGLDKKDYRTLDPNKVKLQRDIFRVIDNRPESTALIGGHDVQALFNFMLNCRSCVANTGVQAGIPPTLLSPAPFKGATLKTLKVKQGMLRQQAAGDQTYSLEVTGPILPSTYTGLNHLFSLTQENYTTTYGVHDQTTAANVTSATYDQTTAANVTSATYDQTTAANVTSATHDKTTAANVTSATHDKTTAANVTSATHDQTTAAKVTSATYDQDVTESSDLSRNSTLGKEAIRDLTYNGEGFTWNKY